MCLGTSPVLVDAARVFIDIVSSGHPLPKRRGLPGQQTGAGIAVGVLVVHQLPHLQSLFVVGLLGSAGFAGDLLREIRLLCQHLCAGLSLGVSH